MPLTGRIGRRAVHSGHYISGSAHLALLGWLAFGGIFAADPLPFEATDVSVISSADFEALMAAQVAPQSATEVIQPAAPQAGAGAPSIPAPSDTQTDLPAPAQVQTPDTDPAPDVSEIAPLPRADISDQAPVLNQPEADIAVLTPQISDTPVPEAAERVAPEAVAPPEPDATPDPVEQQAVAPDAAGDTPQEPAEATAPEAAATQIVTEAEKPARLMEQSRRPPARRPEAPAPVAATPPDAPAQDVAPGTTAAVNAALQEALGAPDPAPVTPQGPPLSAGEKESLRVAVSSCWNVGSLSTDALSTTVVVEVSMTPDGKPVVPSIRLASSSGGSEAAARQAFEAARRAIIRCGARGFDLPSEKYSQWQEIEMTFNPEGMRLK